MARTYGVSALLAALPEECAMRRRRFPARRANGAACNGKKYLCTAMYAGKDAADQVHCAPAVE